MSTAQTTGGHSNDDSTACRHCGTPLAGGHFCPECGRPITPRASAPPIDVDRLEGGLVDAPLGWSIPRAQFPTCAADRADGYFAPTEVRQRVPEYLAGAPRRSPRRRLAAGVLLGLVLI